MKGKSKMAIMSRTGFAPFGPILVGTACDLLNSQLQIQSASGESNDAGATIEAWRNASFESKDTLAQVREGANKNVRRLHDSNYFAKSPSYQLRITSPCDSQAFIDIYWSAQSLLYIGVPRGKRICHLLKRP